MSEASTIGQELEAVSDFIKKANSQGLLVECIWSMVQAGEHPETDSFQGLLNYGLDQWDCL